MTTSDRETTDPRKGGVWGNHTRAGVAWTDKEDRQLIAWGCAVGYDFVAGHDLGREPREGSARIAWLCCMDRLRRLSDVGCLSG